MRDTSSSGHIVTVSTKREVISYKISARSLSSNVDISTYVPLSLEVDSVANTASTSSAHDYSLYNPIYVDFHAILKLDQAHRH